MKMFNLSICSPSPSHSIDGDMYENHDFSYLRPFDLSGYDPRSVMCVILSRSLTSSRLQKLIRLGHGCRPTVHKVFAQEDILGLNGSIVLVGDAAHSILVCIYLEVIST
jgi:hypothetical protein